MLRLYIEAGELEALEGHAAEFDRILADELQTAAKRIGARLNATAKRILRRKVYDIEIPFRKRLQGELLEKARRQVGAGRKASEDQVLARVRGKFGGTSSGQPFRKWKRTGNLLGQEGFEVQVTAEGVLTILYNAAPYALARNALGGPPEINPSGRRSGEQSGDSPTKSVQWLDEAVQVERDWIRDEYLAAVQRAAERLIGAL